MPPRLRKGGDVKLMRRCISVVAATCVLAACTHSSDDLDRKIAEIKNRPAPDLEQPPVVRTFEVFEYQPGDRRDPFTSPFETEEPDRAADAGSGPRPDANRRKELLERFPLDAMDMVGTLNFPPDVWALVKDPEGLIHRVKPGNYLGQNDGRIVGISDDRIELVELIPNGFGGWMERKASVALADAL